MKQTAKTNYLRIAPRKVRVVADVLKGLPVQEAEAQLMLQRRRAAKPLLKLLRSAVANAKNNQRVNPDYLYIESIRVDGGPMLKRFLPRARGTATPIEKKTSHVSLVLAENTRLTPRFTIVVPKKEKKLPDEERRARKEKAREEMRDGGRSRRPGFFRRMFSRKTGV